MVLNAAVGSDASFLRGGVSESADNGAPPRACITKPVVEDAREQPAAVLTLTVAPLVV